MKGRMVCLDYGLKRTGIAWTDPLQMIATGLVCIETKDLEKYLDTLFVQEKIVHWVIGLPTKIDGSDTHITTQVKELAVVLKNKYPETEVSLWDERFSSKQAMETMILAGVPKHKRADKKIINTVAATLILQDFISK